MNTAYDSDNNRIKVGDCVDFKSDIEQYGEVKAISDCGMWLTVGRENGFDGAYIGGQTRTRILASRCWKSE